MITASQLEPYRHTGVAAAARALHRNARTIISAAIASGFEFSTVTAIERRRRAQSRRSLAPAVRRLAGQRVPQFEIARQLGITRPILRRIAAEYGININSRSLG